MANQTTKDVKLNDLQRERLQALVSCGNLLEKDVDMRTARFFERKGLARVKDTAKGTKVYATAKAKKLLQN